MNKTEDYAIIDSFKDIHDILDDTRGCYWIGTLELAKIKKDQLESKGNKYKIVKVTMDII